MKVSVALSELPNFKARPGTHESHHFGQINTPLTKQEWQQAYETARAGGLPDRLWTELYFQTAYDDTVSPAGTHLMSVFAQYVPYNFTQGNWDDWRERAGQVALDPSPASARTSPTRSYTMRSLARATSSSGLD